MICILIYDCLRSESLISVSAHLFVEVPFFFTYIKVKRQRVVKSLFWHYNVITRNNNVILYREWDWYITPLFIKICFGIELSRVGIDVIIVKPSNGCSSVIFKNVLQSNQAAISII